MNSDQGEKNEQQMIDYGVRMRKRAEKAEAEVKLLRDACAAEIQEKQRILHNVEAIYGAQARRDVERDE